MLRDRLFSYVERQYPAISTPHGVMLLVLTMYIVKVLVKLGVGTATGSIMMTADGFHNLSDIFEAGFVIFAVAFATTSGNGEYPFGRRNIESVVVLVIGIMLMVIGVRLALSSIYGLEATFLPGTLPKTDASWLAPPTQSLEGMQNWYWFAAIASVGSIALSVVVSSLQIAVGTHHAKPVIVGDGRETQSDGIIETVVLIGITGEYFFAVPWIEYVLGPVAAYFVAHAGWELAEKGWQTLLQRSIGTKHDEQIEDILHGHPGIVEVPDIKTFMIGGMAVVIAKVVSQCSAEMNKLAKPVMVEAIGAYLRDEGFPSFACYLRFEAPPLRGHRIAYAVTREGSGYLLAATLENAAGVLIVDMVRDEEVRGKFYSMTGMDLLQRASFLGEKRVRVCLQFLDPDQALMACLGEVDVVPISISSIDLG